MKPRQRHMRGEFAAFRVKPDALHHPLKLRLQLDQRLAWHDGSNHGARLTSAEARQALQRHLEWLAIDPDQHGSDLVGGRAVDIADESQGDVVIVGIYPAGAGEAAP